MSSIGAGVSYILLSSKRLSSKRVNSLHIGPLTKVIPLKLFLDIAPRSSVDITCALRFVSFQRLIENVQHFLYNNPSYSRILICSRL